MHMPRSRVREITKQMCVSVGDIQLHESHARCMRLDRSEAHYKSTGSENKPLLQEASPKPLPNCVHKKPALTHTQTAHR